MSELIPPPAWMAQAACAQVGHEEWFPDKGSSTTVAKRICNGDDRIPECPVKAICGEYAITNDERGVWGGLSERERRAIRDAREREVSDAA